MEISKKQKQKQKKITDSYLQQYLPGSLLVEKKEKRETIKIIPEQDKNSKLTHKRDFLTADVETLCKSCVPSHIVVFDKQ